MLRLMYVREYEVEGEGGLKIICSGNMHAAYANKKFLALFTFFAWPVPDAWFSPEVFTSPVAQSLVEARSRWESCKAILS